MSTFVLSKCYSSFVHATFRPFRNIQRATRISVCVTAVSKSHEFFVESSLTFLFFRQRRLRLRINASIFFHDDARYSTSTTHRCLFNDVGHYGVPICGGDVISIFPSTRTCPELYPEISLFVEGHPASKVALSNIPSHHGATICSDDVILIFF